MNLLVGVGASQAVSASAERPVAGVGHFLQIPALRQDCELRRTPPAVLAAVLLGATCLTACLGSGGGSLDYDMAVHNAAGTITVGDTKLYSRETLINERAADIAWIDRLIAASEDPSKISFKPSLIREMEEISAFSAALGVRYDPSAGVAYQRSNQTGEIQQEIDVLKAKFALAQLRRDIELAEAKFPNQTDPVNSELGMLGAGGGLPAASVTPPDASQVAATVNALVDGVTKRLDAEVKPIGKTEVVSTPAEDFQDRLAYRNMLKAARNAAGLDELHDAGNNRLVRLNLQATVLPDPRHAQSLGAIQVKIDDGNEAGPRAYLYAWLQAVNVRSDWRIDATTFGSSTTLAALEDSGDFARARIGTFQTLMPVLTDGPGRDLNPDNLFSRANWTQDVTVSREYFGGMLAVFSVGATAREAALTRLCQPNSPLALALDRADARTKSYELVRTVNLAAKDIGIAPPVAEAGAKYQDANRYQNQVFDLIRDRPDCAALVSLYGPSTPTWRLMRRPELGGAEQVRIYDVGPREQAQQVSTIARSAKSLAMAVSLAAAAPGAGVAGNLGAGFRRDVMNRASSLDRLPEVVGYALGGRRTFGWVIGPHATADESGRAKVQQIPKTYDLSVDLSVPAWWTAVKLKVTTAWAPSPRQLTDGFLSIAGTKGNPAPQPIDLPVPLTSPTVDFPAFTQFLIQDVSRAVSFDEIVGGPVNGCVPTTLLLKGRNLWRADRVLLMGMSLGRDAFVIAPHMTGIILTVPAIPAIPGEAAHKQDDKIHVMTPVGDGERAFTYTASLSGENCKAKASTVPSDANAVTITTAGPTSFVVPSLVRIDVSGKNLSKIDEVRLEARKGKMTDKTADGTFFTAEFSRDITEGIEAGPAKLEFLAAKKIVGTSQIIRIVHK